MKVKKKYPFLPNWLTFLRLVLAFPYFIIFLVSAYLKPEAKFIIVIFNFIVFVLLIFSDFWDGFLARRWKVVSQFGKIMDPIADKIIINGSLIILSAILEIVPLWMVIVFLMRDIVVDGVRNLLVTKGLNISASWWGKGKTLCQTVAIIVLFIGYLIYGPLTNLKLLYLWNLPLLIALVLALVSAFFYLVPAFKYLKFWK